MKKILVIGSFMTDLVVQTPRMPLKGETMIGSSFSIYTGGKGANQAVQAARLGGPVTMVGAIGDDEFGKAHLKSLNDAGVNISHVVIVPGVASGVGNVLLEPSGNNRIVIIPGANMELKSDYIQSIRDVISQNDIVVVQLEIPLQTVRLVIKIAKEDRKLVVLNPAPGQLLEESILRGVDYLVPNETELGVVAGMPACSMKEIVNASTALVERGVGAVITTLGNKGAVYIDGEINRMIPSYKVDPIDTTAAGDSFIGAFVVGLARGLENIPALDYATAAAALTTQRLGSQPSLPTFQDVEEALSKGELIRNEKV